MTVTVPLAPSAIRVIVHHVSNRAADDLPRARRPILARRSVPSSQFNGGDVMRPVRSLLNTAGGTFMPSLPPAAFRHLVALG
jgi:hypothetical protein